MRKSKAVSPPGVPEFHTATSRLDESCPACRANARDEKMDHAACAALRLQEAPPLLGLLGHRCFFQRIDALPSRLAGI